MPLAWILELNALQMVEAEEDRAQPFVSPVL